MGGTGWQEEGSQQGRPQSTSSLWTVMDVEDGDRVSLCGPRGRKGTADTRSCILSEGQRVARICFQMIQGQGLGWDGRRKQDRP